MTRLQRWINSPWWEELDPVTKFGYLGLAACAVAGLVAAIVLAITG